MKQLLRWIPSPKRPLRLHTAFQPWLRWTGFWYCKMGSSSKTAPIANCSPPGNITRPYGGCRAEVFCRVENALALCLISYALVVMVPKLPSLDALINYRPAVPLRIYTADHVLIGEFGVQRRQPVR